MTTSMIRIGLGLGLALAAGVTGCAKHSPESAETATAGATMQQNGIMLQSDYVRMDGLAKTVRQTHMISDNDLAWTVTHLSMEKSSIARARAFNTLAEIRPISPTQKAKILPAITPYLSSSDTLDQLGAQRVEKAVQAGG